MYLVLKISYKFLSKPPFGWPQQKQIHKHCGNFKFLHGRSSSVSIVTTLRDGQMWNQGSVSWHGRQFPETVYTSCEAPTGLVFGVCRRLLTPWANRPER